MRKPTLLILAAGMGSRYGGLKQLDGVGPNGETIMDYSLYDAIKAGFGKVVFVIRDSFRAQFEEKIGERYSKLIEVQFAAQELEMLPSPFKLNEKRAKPWGTGHALLVAADYIDGPFAVINADDFYGRDSFKALANFLSGDQVNQSLSMVGFKASNTLSSSGTVSRGLCTISENSYLLSVEEHHQIAKEGEKIYGNNSKGERVEIAPESFVSMNMWGFNSDIFLKGQQLFREFLEREWESEKAEFYIPSIVNTLLERQESRCKVLSTNSSWFGITYKEERELVEQKIGSLIEEGLYPTPLFK